jgi:hypothetical protein
MTTALAFPGAAFAASADDPPGPTTTVAPEPEPVPDPAPPPKSQPAPKPKPKPKPASAPAPARRSQPAPQPVAPSPVVRSHPSSAPSTKPRPQAKAKPKKKVQRKAQPKPKVVAPKAKVTKPVRQVGLRRAALVKSGDPRDDVSLLIVMGLGLAIACFTIAVIPATAVRWRPAAIFVSERQVDLTVLGLALLMVTAFIFFWTKGL